MNTADKLMIDARNDQKLAKVCASKPGDPLILFVPILDLEHGEVMMPYASRVHKVMSVVEG